MADRSLEEALRGILNRLTRLERRIKTNLPRWIRVTNRTAVKPTATFNADVVFNGSIKSTRQPKVLWAGAAYMNGSQSITLAEPVANQLTGIELVWQRYSGGQAIASEVVTQFISKAAVAALPGSGHDLLIPVFRSDGGVPVIFMKYVYVSNGGLAGHAMNGIAPANNHVLTRVHGV